jgi:hypothetical protein
VGEIGERLHATREGRGCGRPGAAVPLLGLGREPVLLRGLAFDPGPPPRPLLLPLVLTGCGLRDALTLLPPLRRTGLLLLDLGAGRGPDERPPLLAGLLLKPPGPALGAMPAGRAGRRGLPGEVRGRCPARGPRGALERREDSRLGDGRLGLHFFRHLLCPVLCCLTTVCPQLAYLAGMGKVLLR